MGGYDLSQTGSHGAVGRSINKHVVGRERRKECI
jgi:hypothetical protein